MSLGMILLYIRLAGLIIQYGIKLVKYFKSKHDSIEEEAKVTVMTSDDKAKLFNSRATNEITFSENRVAGRSELNDIRERVWKAHNPSKTPKPLKDPRLRIRGKTKKR